MEGMCKSLVAAGDHLFSKRQPLLSLWQEIAENFYPERAQFTRDLSLGEEFASNLMTSFPVIARRDLGNSFASMLRQNDWFKITTAREEKQDQAAKEWLEWATQTQKRATYARAAQFARATKEGDHDFSAFGQCAISTELNSRKDDLLYRCWHLRDLAWCENADGDADTFHLKWKPAAQTLVKMFPKTVHEKVKDCMGPNKNPYQEINCRRIIVPADSYESPIGKKWKTPYVSVTIDQDNNTILEEAGSWNKVFVVPRWQTVSGSQYAYSPATIVALPDARLIQQMTLVLLEAGEKAVNPPLIAYQESLRSDIDTRAGGVSWIDAAYDDRTGAPIQPLYNDRTGIPTGLNMRDDLRATIHEAFYLNKLTLPTQGDMTAYEVSQRVQEYIRQALPIFGPMESEYNGALCEITFDVLLRNGTFSAREIPESIAGQEIEFRFESPLQSAAKSGKVAQFHQTAGLLAEAVQADPTARFNWDVNKSFRDAIEGTGAPIDWINTEPEVAQMLQADQQKQQAQQMMQQTGNAAQIAQQVGKAGQELAGAA